MLIDIVDEDLRSTPCRECLGGAFELGPSGARVLDDMPSFGGHKDLEFPIWQGRDPLLIFSTILEFFLVFFTF